MNQGAQGVCEPSGFCSFPDSSCDGGRRYEDHAGDGLASQCLPAACGGIGATCCAAESGADPCIGGAACIGGTCQACVADIGLGRRFACRLHVDKTLACSGENVRGELGIGLAGAPQPEAAAVRDSTGAVIGDAIAVAAGKEHACAIRSGGTVWCWGANNAGKLGVGDTADRAAATQVIDASGVPLANIEQLAIGDDSTCARGGGTAWCWGDNAGGQLGDGTTTAHPKAAPVLVAAGGATFTGITNLASGARHVCLQKSDEVWCWGDNHNGPIGDGTAMSRPNPVKVYTASQIALGRWHTCALDADGTMSCWGWTGHGRLGQGKDSSFGGGNQLTPVKVLTALDGAPFTGVAQVIAGGVSCALMQDKTVYCWGDDHYGQTGTGAGSVVPVQVKKNDGTPLTDVMRVVSRNANACATRTGGEIVCWGRNTEGTLGDATLLDRGTPVPLKADCR